MPVVAVSSAVKYFPQLRLSAEEAAAVAAHSLKSLDASANLVQHEAQSERKKGREMRMTVRSPFHLVQAVVGLQASHHFFPREDRTTDLAQVVGPVKKALRCWSRPGGCVEVV